MVETSLGIESVTWYQTDQNDGRRVVITFQDELREPGHPAIPDSGKLPGEIELFGGDLGETGSNYARMSFDTPDNVEDLAKALLLAAQDWRHCIKECNCDDHVEEKISNRDEVISIRGFDFDIDNFFGDGAEPEDE